MFRLIRSVLNQLRQFRVGALISLLIAMTGCATLSTPDFHFSDRSEIYYFIRISDERPVFIIDVFFRGDEDGTTQILNPSLSADHLKTNEEQVKILPNGDASRFEIQHDANQIIHLTYEVAAKKDRGSVTFQPWDEAMLDDQYYQFLGRSVFIRPDWKSDRKIKIGIRYRDFSKLWSHANSFSLRYSDEDYLRSFAEFSDTLFVGGKNLKISEFRLNRRLVGSTFSRFDFSIPDETLLEMTRKGLTAVRYLFGDYGYPFYLMTWISAKANEPTPAIQVRHYTDSLAIVLASSVTNTTEIERDFLRQLMERWFGVSEPYVEGDLKTMDRIFIEGLREYFVQLSLLKTGSISLNDWIKQWNDRVKNFSEGGLKGSDRYAFLGMAMALDLNALLKNRSGVALSDWVREVFSEVELNQKPFAEMAYDDLGLKYFPKGLKKQLDGYFSELNRRNSKALPNFVSGKKIFGPCASSTKTQPPMFKWEKRESDQLQGRCLEWFGI